MRREREKTPGLPPSPDRHEDRATDPESADDVARWRRVCLQIFEYGRLVPLDRVPEDGAARQRETRPGG